MLDDGLRNVISSPTRYGRGEKKLVFFFFFPFLLKEPGFLLAARRRGAKCHFLVDAAIGDGAMCKLSQWSQSSSNGVE